MWPDIKIVELRGKHSLNVLLVGGEEIGGTKHRVFECGRVGIVTALDQIDREGFLLISPNRSQEVVDPQWVPVFLEWWFETQQLAAFDGVATRCQDIKNEDVNHVRCSCP